MSKTKEELEAEIELLELEIKARKLRLELESLQPNVSPEVGPDKGIADILERLRKQSKPPYVPGKVMSPYYGWPYPWHPNIHDAWLGVEHQPRGTGTRRKVKI